MATMTPLGGVPHLIKDLKEAIGNENVSTDESELRRFNNSKNPLFAGVPHAVVVHVRSTDDVIRVVKVASSRQVPIVPYSGGTSLEGQITGTGGTICLDLSRMNRILQINVEDADVVCEAGVVWNELNGYLEKQGIPLFFPLDPGLGATIGGLISTGCSGTNAVKYGTARGEYILNLTAVLPSGEVIKTRQRARKCSAGFDLTKLFIGAEGTLGIVTEATVRLVPRLPVSIGTVIFPDLRSCTLAVGEVLNHGASIQCAELIDELTMKALNMFGKYPHKRPEVDTVMFKYQGSDAIRADTSRIVEEVVAKYGGKEYNHITDAEEVDVLWNDRKHALIGLFKMYPGRKGYMTDVCVPVSKLPELIEGTKKDLDDHGLIAPIAGHIGDGNFHCFILYSSEEDLKIVQSVADAMVRRAIALEGTCTGEHAVGLGKKKYLAEELGEGTVALMKTIKAALDPHNLLNPGKLYPD